MKKIFFILLSVFFLNITSSQEYKNISKDELIIKFKPGSKINFENCISTQKFNNDILDLLNMQLSVSKIKRTGNKKTGHTYILKFTTSQDINHLIKIYLETGFFEYVEPNFMGKRGGQPGIFETIPNDTYFSRQYGLYNDGTFTLSPSVEDADIDMELAWDIEQGDSSIIVAILDTGVKLDHPELNNRIWTNSNEVINNSDDDENGYIDDIQGWDFVNIDNNPTDDNGHGTNVTGIIGANGNNNLGYAGVDWNCKLMVCKILDQNSWGYYSWWTDAIYYAVDNGADVINMSLGGSDFSNLLNAAVDYAFDNGVTIVACMMNEDNDVTYYPAGFQNTIAVGSTNPDDDRSSPFFWNPASGSNFGNHIDVVAPGNYIFGLNHQSNTNYNTYWGGTSQATPLVSGLSALLLAQDPTRTPADIRNIIRSTAEDQVGNTIEDTPGFDIYFGYGRINAHQALLQQTTSIDELNIGGQGFSIFPNPATSYLVISGNLNDGRVQLLNTMGSVIFEQKTTSEQNLAEIDISKFPKGVYIVQVSDNISKKNISKKLIIQ